MRRKDISLNADIEHPGGADLSAAQASRATQNRHRGNALLVGAVCVGMGLLGAITVTALRLMSDQNPPVQTAQLPPEVNQPVADIPQPLPQTLASPPLPGAFAIAETEPLDPADAIIVRDAILAALEGQDTLDVGQEVTRDDPALLAVQDCVSELDAFLSPLFLQFDLGAASISARDAVMLEQISEKIIGCDKAHVMIAGHADSLGDDLTNLELSWERADRTLARLVALGVDPAAVEAIGFGARAPSSQGSDEELGIDRRVDFRVIPRRDPRP